jgi:hypothetical protein
MSVEDSDGASAIASFPNIGVSPDFLSRILRDPRLATPVVDLPFVSATGAFADLKSVVAPLGLEAARELDTASLRALSQVNLIRHFSVLPL